MANRESDITITNEESGDDQDADVSFFINIKYSKGQLYDIFSIEN